MVTGGAGFIGSHLTARLLAEGMSVLVVDDCTSGNPANVDPRARLEVLDITSADLTDLLRKWRPAVVFHLAAQSSVPRSFADPLRDLAVNVVGTHRVCAAAHAAGVRRLVFVSSGGAIYGETLRPANERTAPAPMSYYGLHKLAGEGHVALAGLPYAIARPSNVYGPRQRVGLDGAVVAAFVHGASQLDQVTIHGDGQQTRDLIHVTDVNDALVLLGRPESPVGIWNVATGRSVSVNALADLVERMIGRPVQRAHAPNRSGDVRVSAISSAALRRLGWRPHVTLAAGIAALLAGTTRAVGQP